MSISASIRCYIHMTNDWLGRAWTAVFVAGTLQPSTLWLKEYPESPHNPNNEDILRMRLNLNPNEPVHQRNCWFWWLFMMIAC